MAQPLLTRVTENILTSANTDPPVPLDWRLLEEAELVLPETISAAQKQDLVVSISSVLPGLQQNPTPLVNLLLRLVSDYSYSNILALGNIPFTDGLAVGEQMVAFNRLILAILRKATFNAADAASVAGMLDTVLALVRLWLCTSDTGIASEAGQVLFDLLKVDHEIQPSPDAHIPAGGQGLIWKRIFGDRDIYRTFFEACSLSGPTSIKLSKSQRTLAQARLLEWLPKVGAIDWSAITRSHHADVEVDYKVDGGLLDFASLHMVDTRDDVLMYRCLIDFFSDLLQTTKPSMRLPGAASDSIGLRYLISKGLHTRTSALYVQLPGVQLDPVELMFLYGPAGNYIGTYAASYPEHFLASQMPKQVLERLRAVFDLSSANWAHGDSPKHDLHVLASLPRKALRGGTLSLLPSKATNPDVLNTLATIFHGPDQEILHQPNTPLTEQQDPSEAIEARALYYHYLSANPRFWHDIATHADTVALTDLALAALNVLLSVITATWPVSSNNTSAEPSLPSNIATPSTGALAILSPPALEYTLPYLFKPPQTFSNLVGGRGDAESSAYKIAAAKFDALRAFHTRLLAQVDRTPGEGYEEILATVEKRLADGPLSREGEVGGRVGVLEL